MSDLATVRSAIVTALESIPLVGQVHPYERYLREQSKLEALYLVSLPGGERQLRGWFLRRVGTTELGIALGRSVDAHTWQLRGLMALSDEPATELAFDDLIEAVRDQVRADPTFGGVCEPEPMDGQSPQGVQVLDSSPVRFCGVLCHSALLQLRTWSYR